MRTRLLGRSELIRVFSTLNHFGLSFSHHQASKPGSVLHRDICAHGYTFSIHRDLLSASLAPVQLNVQIA